MQEFTRRYVHDVTNPPGSRKPENFPNTSTGTWILDDKKLEPPADQNQGKIPTQIVSIKAKH